MTKAMSKTALVRHLAEQNEMTRAQVNTYLECVGDTAYKQAKNGFTIPGLGKLDLVARKARWGRNPATGEKIRIKAKKVVKFRIAKACKDSILPPTAAKKKKR